MAEQTDELLDEAVRILVDSTPGQAIVIEDMEVPADFWRFGDEVMLDAIIKVLEEAQMGRIEKDESKHFGIARKIADKIVERAADHGFSAEVVSSGDVHEHPFVVEIQVGKNRLFAQSQWIGVTIYDSDDISLELSNDIAAVLGRGNTIVKDKPSGLESILKVLENKVKEAEETRPETDGEKKMEQEDFGDPEDEAHVLPLKNRQDTQRFLRHGSQPPSWGGGEYLAT